MATIFYIKHLKKLTAGRRSANSYQQPIINPWI